MHGASQRLNGTMGSAQLQTGRLGNQFAGLAGQLTGIHPIIGNVAGVMGNFAVGSGLTVGVLGGLAAIALAWDTLTKSARAATKAQDDAVKSLLRARHLKIVGGAVGEDVKQSRDKLNALLAEGTRLQKELDANRGIPILEGLTLEKIQANEDAIHAVQQAISSGLEDIAESADKATASTVKLKDTFNEVRDAAEEYQLQQQIAALKLGMVLDELQKIADLHAEIAGYTKFTGMPNVSMPFEGLDRNEKKQLVELGILTDTTEASGNKIHDAIWGSATQMANQIVGALNVGGGGKGSNLGGAIGGTAGFALGFAFGGGPIGGAIGSTIGNIAGSLFGGLFDSNTKSVNANTLAVQQNTQALLLHAPAGYRVDRYGYGNSAALYEAVAEEAMRRRGRGGVQILGMAT